MFKLNTLFVVGTGASFEFGLPLGSALAAIIRKKMDIDFVGFNQHIGEGDIDLFNQLTSRFQSHGVEYSKNDLGSRTR
jgi:Zn-dependent M32 family carboxypeptidase